MFLRTEENKVLFIKSDIDAVYELCVCVCVWTLRNIKPWPWALTVPLMSGCFWAALSFSSAFIKKQKTLHSEVCSLSFTQLPCALLSALVFRAVSVFLWASQERFTVHDVHINVYCLLTVYIQNRGVCVFYCSALHYIMIIKLIYCFFSFTGPKSQLQNRLLFHLAHKVCVCVFIGITEASVHLL